MKSQSALNIYSTNAVNIPSKIGRDLIKIADLNNLAEIKHKEEIDYSNEDIDESTYFNK